MNTETKKISSLEVIYTNIGAGIRNEKTTINILKAVRNITYFNFQDLNLKTRKKYIVKLRYIIYKLLKENTSFNLKKIGSLFNQDHATVLHAIKRIDESEIFEKDFYKLFLTIKKELIHVMNINEAQRNEDLRSIFIKNIENNSKFTMANNYILSRENVDEFITNTLTEILDNYTLR